MSDLIQPKAPTCGSCRFGAPIPNNLQAVTCFGAPPQLVGIPGKDPQGRPMVQFQPMRPMLARNEPACAQWREKPALLPGVPFNPSALKIEDAGGPTEPIPERAPEPRVPVPSL